MPVPAWRALQIDEVIGFRAEDIVVGKKEDCCLATSLSPELQSSRCAQ